MASHLNGRYIKTFEFSFEEIVNVLNWTKRTNKELKKVKRVRKRKCQLFLGIECN